MTIDDKMKKYKMLIIEKLQKHRSYRQAKLINTNILQVNKYFLLIKQK